MQPGTTCGKCQGRMSEGVLVDTGYGSYSVLSYPAGQADRIALVRPQGPPQGRDADPCHALRAVRIS